MALSASETDQLKATLVIRNKPFLVKLTSSEICWEQISSPSATGGRASFTQLSGSPANTSSTSCKTKKDIKRRAVKCNEVIGVKLGCGSDSPIKGKFHHLEAITIDSTFFSIWFIERYQQHRWRPQHVSFQSRDSTVAQQWVDRMQAILSAPELKRPRSLLLFINPIGGRKKGPSIFQKTARPLFELAGVSCDVVMTERHNHAKDVLLDYDLTKIDGVVCVGGDGMLSELMHGLLTLSLQEQGLSQPHPNDPLPQPSLRIGVIPAGSTNAVVCSTNGTEDPMTATLHIILGDSVAMDVGTVHHGDKFLKYNISLLGYGYYGDCMMESEETRWMGPCRYNWLGFKKLMNHRVYDGEVSFLPSGCAESHPQDNTWCKAGCTLCQATGTVQKAARKKDQGDTSVFAEGDAASVNLQFNESATAVASDWNVIRGQFLAINSFLMSCRCHLSRNGVSPTAHLGDGCADLILIRPCSRIQFLQHLYRCMLGNGSFDFPFVDVFRVKAFKFRPFVEDLDDTHVERGCCSNGAQELRSEASRNSVWNCDGEIVYCSTLQFRVHRQVIQLFARGIEDTEGSDSHVLLGCIEGKKE